MNAQAILDKILSDAKDFASASLKDANDRAAAMRHSAEDRITSARAEVVARAEREATHATARMERMAELEERKLLLSDKRRLMDQAFALALEKMNAMPAGQASAYVLATVQELASGTEEVVPGALSPWVNAAFVDKANEGLKAMGKQGALTLSDKTCPGVNGCILSQHDTEIHCTFEALLTSQRLELEAEVAQTLFPEH